VGDYTAIALCGDVEVEGFEKPAFGVVQPFTVVHNVETSVALEAKLMNMAVSVAPKVYPAETKSRFEQYFSTWSVEVLRENEVQEIDVKIAEFAKDEARVLYLKPEAFKLKLNYTHQSNGKTGSRTIEVGENVKACTLYEVSLDVNDGHVGGKQIVITFDDTTEIIELGDIEVGEGE
jgi:hypothetical protein